MMLRRIYRCVLRLHPPAFRSRFGDEILSIFDQATGRFSGFRLLMDNMLSLVRQWTLRPEFWRESVSAPTPQAALDGKPSFCTINPFRPRPTAFVPGLILSIAIFGLTCVAIKYSWIRVLHIRIPEVEFEAPQWIPPHAGHSVIPDRSAEPVSHDRVATSSVPNALAQTPEAVSRAVSNTSTPSAVTTKARKNDAVQPLPFRQSMALQSKGNGIAPTSPELDQTAAAQLLTTTAPTTFAEDMTLDAAARHRVIDGASAIVTKDYVDAEVAQKMAIALRDHETNGDDNQATDGPTFADLLTSQMRNVSNDKHVAVIYSAVETSENSPTPTTEEVARYTKEMKQNNCTFEKIAILPHKIGYLKFNSFPDASICGATASAAMAKLNHADAIIFDLRDNPGGYANMVALVATYLFDRPTHLNDFYDRSKNSTEESWTLPPVPGNRLADKPAFVLTSSTTFSAAEGFSYDLKMLKRATLVGERTSGRRHMGAPHRIDDHFTIRVPSLKVINPISKTNWEGTGVEPDVKVKATDALRTAINLAESNLQKK
jgi:C-terminal processing protease CtpA/Prc